MKKIELNEDIIYAESGASIIQVANFAYENSLTGIEFACGIPGSIGGAVRMNAGAYGRSMQDIVQETTYIDSNLEIKTISNDMHKFDYRNSCFSKNEGVILSTKIKLNRDNKKDILKKMEENKKSRKEKQPLTFPNAGSTFKRGNNFITAELIDLAGLKGYNVGDAYVSEKHAGFIVNKGNATASNVLELIEHIKKEVKKKFDKDLELEIQVLGEDL